MTSARVTTAAPNGTQERTFKLERAASGSTYFGAGIAIAVEGALWHLWFARTHPIVAWSSTSINAILLIWLWRAYRAQLRLELRISGSNVDLLWGKTVRCRFPQSSIATVEAATWRSVPDVAKEYLNGAMPLEPNVTIVLATPIYAKLPLGMTKRVSRIDLRAADPDGLIAELRRL